jgi:hypothetical protein
MVAPADMAADVGPTVPLFQAEQDSSARRSVSVQQAGSGVRAFTPTLWRMQMQHREERPRQERDSLRSRSKEGRPGSRKHRRWALSQDFAGSLRKAMRANGENVDGVDFENFEDKLILKNTPSAFYKLIEKEGASHALEAWAAAENARGRPRSRPPHRPRTEAQVAEHNDRAARQVFGESWSYILKNEDCKDFLLDLEGKAVRAFSSCDGPGDEDAPGKDEAPETKVGAVAGDDGDKEVVDPQFSVIKQWLLSWDGSALTTMSGNTPADEILIVGLDGVHRRTVHQLSRFLGLHSESRPDAEALDGKVLALRPPRRQVAGGQIWSSPVSLASVLAASAT